MARHNVAELYNTTAKAYGMPTLDDYARAVAWKQAEEVEEEARQEAEADEAEAHREAEDVQPAPAGESDPDPAPGKRTWRQRLLKRR